MDDFLALLFAWPTLPWTCLLLAALVYWVTVILGALDMDVLGGADGHGHAHGADVGHGDVGHGHGADAGHGHGEGLADGAAAKEGVLAMLLSALKLRSVPVTISLSLLALFAWIVSFVLARHVGPLLPLPAVLTAGVELVLSAVVGLLCTSVAVRPLAPLFRAKQGTRHDELVGKVVRVTTGRVDGKFGEAKLEDGGAGLQLQVRCADPDALARDDEALILGWNAETESFEVEPMRSIEGRSGKAGR